MKNLLRILLVSLFAIPLFFSCGSTAVEESAAEPELPVVETAVPVSSAQEESFSEEPVAAISSPVADLPEEAMPGDEPVMSEESLPENQPEEDVLLEEMKAEDAASDECIAEEDVLSEDYFANEFIPVEKDYFVDVSGYYDGFSITEDDFVAVVVEPEPAPQQTVIPQEEPSTDIISMTEPDLEPETTMAIMPEEAPAMEPIAVPPAREDMKKPVVLVTEEEAAAAAEPDKLVARTELENILSEIPEPEEPQKPEPSRSVIIHKNDILEVPYQGNWWVYLGDANSSGALTFSGREYVAEKTVFTLRATHEGDALLHFFKQDIIAGVMVDDYLAVTVVENTGASEKIELEMFVISQIRPEPVSADDTDDMTESDSQETPAPAKSAAAQNPAEVSDIQYVQYEDKPAEAVSSTQSVPGKSVVIEDESEVASSTEIDDAVEDKPEVLTDEELFMKAQALEATDIEEALFLYKKLTADYPLSPYWNQASKRITYINRFYFFKR